MPKLYIVIPFYNESATLPLIKLYADEFLRAMIKKSKIDKNSQIVYVNDGSTDSSYDFLKKSNVVKYKKNIGHQKALFRGVIYAYRHGADIVATIDSNGRYMFSDIEKLIDEYYKGFEVVYGKRKNLYDNIDKSYLADIYYCLARMINPAIVSRHSEFRLMSRDAIKEMLERYKGVPFMRGLFADTTLSNKCINVIAGPRIAGKTKYNFVNQLKLAMMGIEYEFTKTRK